jgi:dTDP-4-dehydrorhamnose reductase
MTMHEADAGPTLLITGAAGFLGWNLARLLSAAGYHVIASSRRLPPEPLPGVEWTAADLADARRRHMLATKRFDALIHCAAIAQRDRCEQDPVTARMVNIEAAGTLAGLCAANGADCIHISTDLVYDGSRGWYSEDDPVSPSSLYAETKARAEEAVLAAHPGAYILRTALMFGALRGGFGGFLHWTMNTLRDGGVVSLYTNQYRTPLYTADVARAIDGLLRQRPQPGRYHVAGPDRVSRYDLGLIAAGSFQIPSHGVRPVALTDSDGKERFDDTSLRTVKIRAALGLEFTTVRAAFAALRSELHDSRE